MKYIVVLGDGMSDYPQAELNGETPLAYARTPNLDQLADKSILGLAHTIPEHMSPGSDVANLSVMGYDPALFYTGRSPLEAVSLGIQLEATDVTLRCNLVTLSSEKEYAAKTMVDYSADEITTAEAQVLLTDLNQHLGNAQMQFYPGISYRHVLVWKNGSMDLEFVPPHDISDRIIGPYLPQGKLKDLFLDLMVKSSTLLSKHPINQRREAQGLHPANSIWFWGQGQKPSFPSFQEKFGCSGAVVCAVDLIKGLGMCMGLEPVAVPGATGGTETNFLGKAQAAIEQLKQGKDFVYLHIEAPDEAGHRGELATKIRAIEAIDREVIGEIRQKMAEYRELPGMEAYRLLVLPDHPTPLQTKTHAADPVPFLIYQSNQPQSHAFRGYNETTAQSAGLVINPGHQLMPFFLQKN